MDMLRGVFKLNKEVVRTNKIGGLIVFSFLLLLNVSFISAQPPPQVNLNINTGMDVEFTKIGVFENGVTHFFNVHVFNRSDGLRLTNSTTECNFHLFDNTGFHIVNQLPMSYDTTGLDWELNVTSGNFTRNGEYSYLITCNASNIGGFDSVGFEVTQTGLTLETSDSILLVVILIATFILFLGFLYPAITLPYSNKTHEDGSITRISKAKYLKLLSVLFAYGFLMWFLQTLNLISTSFIKLTNLTNFITNIFTYSQSLSVGITLLIIFIIFIETWKDIILSNTIKKFGKAFTDGGLQ